MDILMPGMDGIAATTAIRSSCPDTEVLALTSVLDDAVIRQVIHAGAIGYLMKDTGSDELCHAIHLAASGQVQLSRAVARRLLSEQADKVSLHPLTGRELEVLRQVARGCSNREIALSLGIAEKTVKAHVSNILNKLGVACRTQAALAAIHSGLVSLDENRPA
jgi:DNA-binding NarL/FixJ family response regulator